MNLTQSKTQESIDNSKVGEDNTSIPSTLFGTGPAQQHPCSGSIGPTTKLARVFDRTLPCCFHGLLLGDGMQHAALYAQAFQDTGLSMYSRRPDMMTQIIQKQCSCLTDVRAIGKSIPRELLHVVGFHRKDLIKAPELHKIIPDRKLCVPCFRCFFSGRSWLEWVFSLLQQGFLWILQA